jgi:hypothetical protein
MNQTRNESIFSDFNSPNDFTRISSNFPSSPTIFSLHTRESESCAMNYNKFSLEQAQKERERRRMGDENRLEVYVLFVFGA